MMQFICLSVCRSSGVDPLQILRGQNPLIYSPTVKGNLHKFVNGLKIGSKEPQIMTIEYANGPRYGSPIAVGPQAKLLPRPGLRDPYASTSLCPSVTGF